MAVVINGGDLMRAAGLSSLILHGLVFSIATVVPVRPAQSTPPPAEIDFVEVDPPSELEPESEETPDPVAEPDAEPGGGNGVPLARSTPAPEEPASAEQPEPEEAPEPEAEPIEVETEEVLTTDESAEEAVSTPSDTDGDEPAPGAEARNGEGPPGGRGKGLGPGSGGGGVKPPVDLFQTFLGSLPYAGKLDSTWTQLPRGPAGRVTFRVTLGKDGKLLPIQILGPAPLHLQRMVLRNQQFLRKLRFTHSSGGASRSRVYVLDASVDTRRAEQPPIGESGVKELGRLGIPMKNGAYFTYYSGHHVNLLLYRQR